MVFYQFYSNLTLKAPGFFGKNAGFWQISNACGLKGVKDRDLLYIRKMLGMTKRLCGV